MALHWQRGSGSDGDKNDNGSGGNTRIWLSVQSDKQRYGFSFARVETAYGVNTGNEACFAAKVHTLRV